MISFTRVTVFSQIVALVLFGGVFAAGWYIGGQWHDDAYVNACLAAGGDMQPGVQKLCVIRAGQDDTQHPDVPQTDTDDVRIMHTDAYGLEVTLPPASAPLAESIRSTAQDDIDAFEHDANTDYADYQKDPAYPWRQYALSIGYDTYTAGEYRFYVLNEYYYTGGANGTQLVKTFAYRTNGTIVSLADIVPAPVRDTLVSAVKKKIYDMQGMQPGSDSVFAPDIDALTFDSFTRFYVTDTDVAVLFNEYDVGPGALGAIRVTVPRATLGI
jgi:hypothetical protein